MSEDRSEAESLNDTMRVNPENDAATEHVCPTMPLAQLTGLIANLTAQMSSMQATISDTNKELVAAKHERQKIQADLRNLNKTAPPPCASQPNHSTVISTEHHVACNATTSSKLPSDVPQFVPLSNAIGKPPQGSINMLTSTATCYSVPTPLVATSSASVLSSDARCFVPITTTTYNTAGGQVDVGAEYSSIPPAMCTSYSRIGSQYPGSVSLPFVSDRRRLHELPKFSGKPEDWPGFIVSYHESTTAFGYNDLENTMRLRSCLSGEAEDAVRSMLMYHTNLSEVLSELEFRFGRTDLLVKSQIAEVQNVAPIKEHELEKLIPYATKVKNMCTFLESCQSHQHLANPTLLESLVAKLPDSKKYDWAKVALEIKPYVTIINFSDWLSKVARWVVMIPAPQGPHTTQFKSSRVAGRTENKPSTKPRHMLHTRDTTTSALPKECYLCDKNHVLDECQQFLKLSLPNRWEEVKRMRLCFTCLQKGHSSNKCRKRKSCMVNDCTRIHNPLLHSDDNQIAKPPKQTSTVGTNTTLKCDLVSEDDVNVLFKILPVKIFGPNGPISTFAIFDEGSSITMLNEDVARRMGLSGESKDITLKWFGNVTTTEPCEVVDIQVSGVGRNNRLFELNDVVIKKDMCLPEQSLKLKELHSKYRHLKGLPIHDYVKATPELLIGLKHIHLGVPVDTVKNTHSSGPVVVKSKLGWIVYGPTKSSAINYNGRVMFASECDDSLHDLVKGYFTTESLGVALPTKVLNSKDDTRAKNIMASTTKRIGERFETGLLWRKDDVELPSSLNMAMQRLESVERKMSRNPIFGEQYRQIVNNYLEKGYARKLSPKEAEISTPRTWYLPHFGVRNPYKPNKLRLVFDGAAVANGLSLNSMLLTGPDLYTSLLSILFKFRRGRFGVCADIAEMFHQVLIREEDRDSQRFLWRDGDTSKDVETYQMVAMTFGLTCSPCSAQYVKNLNASEFIDVHAKASQEIVDNHYVDDYVSSFNTEEEAIDISSAVRDIHRRGGFELRGFISNSTHITSDLNRQHDQQSVMDMNLGDSMPNKILGMYWCTTTDTFGFQLKFNKVDEDIIKQKRYPTKRELLSIVMSIYDPLGFLADFVIYMKVLLQEVWRAGIEWDELLTDRLATRWSKWQTELKNITLFTIPRCYSAHLYCADTIELHTFVDASEVAYAAVSYLLIKKEGLCNEVRFVVGKTKCAPLKYLSVPKLELMAAILGVRMKDTIAASHGLKLDKYIFWSDSKTVLAWIKTDHRRYKPFVANRISELLDSSQLQCWYWVPSKMNVADDATRDIFPPKFDANSRWIRGPAWLNDEGLWPTQPSFASTDESQLELRCRSHHIFLNQVRAPLIDITKYSKYSRVKRIIGWMLRFVNNASANIKGRTKTGCELTAEELRLAEICICRQVQMEVYTDEFNTLMEGGRISRTSKIYNLSPVIEEDFVIRLAGRIDNASVIPYATRRPIILPKSHPLTKLIVAHYHQMLRHQNEDSIICEIRRTFWIGSLRQLVRNSKKSCQTCRIQTAEPAIPLMGQLPRDRLTPWVRPFTYTGVDYFGPVHVTIGRRHEKRWIALFTCLTIRAVHLEIAADLSADSCILCLRNFVNLRGVPAKIRSDNGTNFVGAKGELQNAGDLFGNAAVQSEMAMRGIQWQFNCPLNPSAGGCWERLVQSIKRVLHQSLKEVSPRVETLRSYLLEAANIVNSRPLTHVPVSSVDDDPLTPNTFLLGYANVTQVISEETGKICCLRKQWRIAQALKNHFWRRWIREYLPMLTRRSKWFERVKPIKVGDVVIVCDDSVSRNEWPKGIVTATNTGQDGQVRSAEIRVHHKILKRPANRLAVLDIEGGKD